jgi:hypothetical protein
MSSIAARQVNTRVCQLQPNGMLSRGTQAYPGANVMRGMGGDRNQWQGQSAAAPVPSVCAPWGAAG